MIHKLFNISLNYNYKKIFISLSAGASGTLAFSPYDFWPAAILSLTGLLFNISLCNTKQSFLLGLIWGIGFFGSGIYWIQISIAKFNNMAIISIILIMILIIYLSVYPALFSMIIVKIWPTNSLHRIILAGPAIWFITEQLKNNLFGGFPWLEFGYSQIEGPLKGLLPIFGVRSVTFILFIISGLITYSLLKKTIIPLLSVIVIFLTIWPLKLLRWYHLQPERAISIALIQGNIDQKIKWNPDYKSIILNTYLNKTLSIIGKTQIIIWPETAIPDLEINQQYFLSKLDIILRNNNTSLITGIIDAKLKLYKFIFFNTIIVIGESIPYHYPHHNNYYKYHLVPFAETIPLQYFLKNLISYLNIQINPLCQGKYLQPQLTVANMKFTATICYDIIFGEQIRNNFYNNTDFLLTISDDSWFNNSIGPWQHFQIARMRALELGRPLLRSTNNGISAIVNPEGIIEKKLKRNTCSILNAYIIPTKGMTPYANMGYTPLWSIIILFILTAYFIERNTISLTKQHVNN